MSINTFMFDITDEHGLVIGHGTVTASEPIEAVAAVRLVRLDSVRPRDEPPAA